MYHLRFAHADVSTDADADTSASFSHVRDSANRCGCSLICAVAVDGRTLTCPSKVVNCA